MKNNIFLTILILISILIVNQANPLKKESQVDNMAKKNTSELKKIWSIIYSLFYSFFLIKKDVYGSCVAGH